MAGHGQDKILGYQVDVADISAEITRDPNAVASLEAGIDHANIINGGGTNSHLQIDSHIADSTLHFTEASISHLNIADIGTNSHILIDAHIADTTLHFTTLDGLVDVSVVGATSGQVLTYNNSPAGWSAQDAVGGVSNPLVSNLSVGNQGFGIIGPDAIGTYDGFGPNLTAGSSAISGYKGGDITITSGSGTYPGDNTTPAGKIFIQGGSRTYESGNGVGITDNISVSIKGGNGGYYAGNISITGGDNSIEYGTGGDIVLTGGTNSHAINGYGGTIRLLGGNHTGTYGQGGYVFIKAGDSPEDAGGVRIDAGTNTLGTFKSPPVRISGGTSTAISFGGDVLVRGGIGRTTAGGGNVIVQGGTNTDVNVVQGGSVLILPGGGLNTTPGNIELHAADTQTGQASLQFWNDTNTGHTIGNYLELKAPLVTTNLTLTLPLVDGLNGQALQTDSTGILSFDGPPLFTGIGTPEGALAAPQGSLYTDTNGGTSATLYIKENSITSAGWVVVAPGGGGGVNNPMTADLDVGTYSILYTNFASVNITSADAVNITTPDRAFVNLKTDEVRVYGSQFLGSPPTVLAAQIRIYNGSTYGTGSPLLGGSYTSLYSGNALGKGRTFIFPNNDGTDGQVLTISGINNQSTWTSPSGGGNNWISANGGVDFPYAPTSGVGGNYNIAIGTSAQATSTYGALAIGGYAIATHQASISIGLNATSGANYQINVGYGITGDANRRCNIISFKYWIWRRFSTWCNWCVSKHHLYIW